MKFYFARDTCIRKVQLLLVNFNVFGVYNIKEINARIYVYHKGEIRKSPNEFFLFWFDYLNNDTTPDVKSLCTFSTSLCPQYYRRMWENRPLLSGEGAQFFCIWYLCNKTVFKKIKLSVLDGIDHKENSSQHTTLQVFSLKGADQVDHTMKWLVATILYKKPSIWRDQKESGCRKEYNFLHSVILHKICNIRELLLPENLSVDWQKALWHCRQAEVSPSYGNTQIPTKKKLIT